MRLRNLLFITTITLVCLTGLAQSSAESIEKSSTEDLVEMFVDKLEEKTETPRIFNVGHDELCINGLTHHLHYNVSDPVKTVYQVKDLKNLKEVKCDLDGTRLEIIFHDEIHSTEYYTKFKVGGAFLSGISDKSCPMKMDPKVGFLLRNVEGCELNG